MAWPKESRRHGLARKGIPTASGRVQRLKFPRQITNIKPIFDYEKIYDTNTLMIIPAHAESKKHAMWDIDEYIEWLKGESAFGEDVNLTVYLKDERTTNSFDMENFDIEENRLVRVESGGFPREEIRRPLNPNNIENVVQVNAFGTYDLNGELIHDFEFQELFDDIENSQRQQETFNQTYKGKKALRLRDMKWVDIVSPTEFKELE